MRGPTLFKTIAAVGVTMALTSACLSGGGNSGSGGGGSSPTGQASGSTVTIWTSVDQPVLEGLKAGLAPKAQAQGITVNWQKVDNINQVLIPKLTANASDVPDIAFVPQPGLVQQIVGKNKATALDDVVDVNSLRSSMLPGTLEAGTVNGKLYGLLVSANAKSFIWYPKKAFQAAGYKEPQTLEELSNLTDKIKADKSATAPWCLGIGSQAATGWPFTDWVENLVLGQGGPQKYDDWVSHKIKFQSPEVNQALDTFEKLIFTDGNVLGGRKSIASNPFGQAGNPMFDAKPGCMMYKQGSFITTFFPKEVQANLEQNVGVMYFPPSQGLAQANEKPMEGGGDLAMILKNNAGARAVLKLLSDKSIGNQAMNSSFLSPHKDFDVSQYKGAIQQQIAKITYASTVFRFDGSDAMPASVGQGTFWTQGTQYISGQVDRNTMLKNIDDSWPAS